MYGKSAYSRHHRHRTRLVVSKAQCIQPAKDLLQRSWRLSCGTAENGPSPLFTLDLLPLTRKAIHILHIRPGHYLHEILQVDPGYLTWIAFKFTPRIPKQERFAQIARIYHSVYIDILQRKAQQPSIGRYLGKEGEKVENLVLTIFSVRLEDDPYKTQVKGTTPYFYVRQILKLKDASGNLVTFRISSRTASRHSCQLPAMEHAYRIDETVHIASARIANTYTIGKNKWTRLNYVKIRQ